MFCADDFFGLPRPRFRPVSMADDKAQRIPIKNLRHEDSAL